MLVKLEKGAFQAPVRLAGLHNTCTIQLVVQVTREEGQGANEEATLPSQPSKGSEARANFKASMCKNSENSHTPLERTIEELDEKERASEDEDSNHGNRADDT